MPTTSTFLSLAGGGEVAFTFTSQFAQPGSLTFHMTDAQGRVGAEVIVAQGVPPGGLFPPTWLDAFNAAPLAGGGFVVVVAEDNGVVALDSERFHTVTFGAGGEIVGNAFTGVNLLPFLQLIVSEDPRTSFSNLGVWGLGDQRNAVFHNALDGFHLDLQPVNGFPDLSGHIDIALPSAPNLVSQTTADLAFGFANGDRLLVGGSAHPDLTGGAGDDTIIGGAPHDVLRGGDGNDSILGGSGFDDINGNKGDDTIAGGGSGSDWLVGGQGNDLITGQGDFSILYGNLGNDTLNGGSGGEWLRGGQGDDLISGGGGDDWISGDRGNDTEIGGAGADTFNGFSGIGTDRILDFNLSEGDKVQLDPGTHFTLTQVGADTIIDLGGGDRMVLVGVDMTTLSPGWIFGF